VLAREEVGHVTSRQPELVIDDLHRTVSGESGADLTGPPAALPAAGPFCRVACRFGQEFQTLVFCLTSRFGYPATAAGSQIRVIGAAAHSASACSSQLGKHSPGGVAHSDHSTLIPATYKIGARPKPFPSRSTVGG
jgi:hypothetical protein